MRSTPAPVVGLSPIIGGAHPCAAWPTPALPAIGVSIDRRRRRCPALRVTTRRRPDRRLARRRRGRRRGQRHCVDSGFDSRRGTAPDAPTSTTTTAMASAAAIELAIGCRPRDGRNRDLGARRHSRKSAPGDDLVAALIIDTGVETPPRRRRDRDEQGRLQGGGPAGHRKPRGASRPPRPSRVVAPTRPTPRSCRPRHGFDACGGGHRREQRAGRSGGVAAARPGRLGSRAIRDGIHVGARCEVDVAVIISDDYDGHAYVAGRRATGRHRDRSESGIDVLDLDLLPAPRRLRTAGPRGHG